MDGNRWEGRGDGKRPQRGRDSEEWQVAGGTGFVGSAGGPKLITVYPPQCLCIYSAHCPSLYLAEPLA